MRRREYLLGVAGLGSASLAGCSGVLSGGSGSASSDPIDWTTAPKDGESLRPFRIVVHSPSDLYALDDISERQQIDLDSVVTVPWWDDLSPDLVDTTAKIGHAYESFTGMYRVFEGSFAASDVREAIEAHVEESLDRPGGPDEDEIGYRREYEGYDVYRAAGHAVAVQDGRVLNLGYSDLAQASATAITRVVDAVEDPEDTVTATDDPDLELLLDRMESADQWLLELHPDPGVEIAEASTVAHSHAYSVDGDTTTETLTYVLQDADSVEESGLAEHTPNTFHSAHGDVEREVDGRVVEVSASGQTRSILRPRIWMPR